MPVYGIMYGNPRVQRHRRYGTVLGALTLLFLFRVVAQLVTYGYPVPLLPAFDAWHSGVIPYPLLVLSQVLILWLMARATMRISMGQVVPNRVTAKRLLLAGGIYAAVMLARLGLGLTVLDHSEWFTHWLPAVFHLVLATFLLVLGGYHQTSSTPVIETHARR